jgi:glutathione synthase/RimK-type ligase-like ATP-grasp enzyme
LETENIIIKPTVSANADDTFLVNKAEFKKLTQTIKNTFSSKQLIVQPFIDSVITEGEYSLFYFGDKFSHCVLKKPKENDFRVQEEHGGRLKLSEAEDNMLSTAESVLKALPESALYARIDLIRSNNQFLLMEVELIEPSLYFNMDEKAADRFTEAFLFWCKENLSN